MCLSVAGHADAPVEGGARDRQVLQAAAHEARDLVQPLLRQHEIRPRVEVEQLLLIGREPEEIALLLHPFDRRAGLGRDAHLLLVEMRLVLGVIGLVAHRIPAGIFVEIDVAVLLHALPDFLRRAVMALLGGVDEVVVRAIQPLRPWPRSAARCGRAVGAAVSPSLAAVCWIFWPCSSVPVRK